MPPLGHTEGRSCQTEGCSTFTALPFGFWFLVFEVPLTLFGHIAAHAIATGDLALLQIIGCYTAVGFKIGVAALPKSPFPTSLGLAIRPLTAGYGGDAVMLRLSSSSPPPVAHVKR